MCARPSMSGGRRLSVATFGSRTDVGCVREHNEDSLIVAPPLFAVADGMGGHAAGEVASEIAVRTLSDRNLHSTDTQELLNAVVSANYAVINAAREKGRAGMGTTLTAAVLEGERLAIAQVGDSRAYLLHQGNMQQLTRDHSLMADMIEVGQLTPEEARFHPQRSVITRALGSDPDMQPDLYELNVTTGDRLLLCSDGLSTMLEDSEITTILKRCRDPQRCASVLVNEAIAKGGHDNVTVIVVDVVGDSEARQHKIRRKSRALMATIAIILAAIIIGGCYGAYAYTQTTAFLIDENGTVSIYRGVPASFLGLNLSTLERTTDVKTDALQPGVANRLKEGIRVDNLDAAYRLVEDYKTEIRESQHDNGTAADSSSASSASSSTSSSSSSSTGTTTTSTTSSSAGETA